jgi:hypothetical protein
MTQTQAIELVLPPKTLLALKQAAERHHKTETELLVEAVESYLERGAGIDPLLGLFADDAELIDRVTGDALHSRENTPLRVTTPTDG